MSDILMYRPAYHMSRRSPEIMSFASGCCFVVNHCSDVSHQSANRSNEQRFLVNSSFIHERFKMLFRKAVSSDSEMSNN